MEKVKKSQDTLYTMTDAEMMWVKHAIVLNGENVMPVTVASDALSPEAVNYALWMHTEKCPTFTAQQIGKHDFRCLTLVGFLHAVSFCNTEMLRFVFDTVDRMEPPQKNPRSDLRE